ncbi:hypothetical protein ACRAWG_00345 [Methylobacterium sp. P31]
MRKPFYIVLSDERAEDLLNLLRKCPRCTNPEAVCKALDWSISEWRIESGDERQNYELQELKEECSWVRTQIFKLRDHIIRLRSDRRFGGIVPQDHVDMAGALSSLSDAESKLSLDFTPPHERAGVGRKQLALKSFCRKIENAFRTNGMSFSDFDTERRKRANAIKVLDLLVLATKFSPTGERRPAEREGTRLLFTASNRTKREAIEHAIAPARKVAGN